VAQRTRWRSLGGIHAPQAQPERSEHLHREVHGPLPPRAGGSSALAASIRSTTRREAMDAVLDWMAFYNH